MDDASLKGLVNRTMMEVWSFYAQGGEGGFVVERPGLIASVVPAVPDRSVFNSVIYSDPAALSEARDELAQTYDDAGVRAWTVWVPEEDTGSAGLLEGAGHVLDATPRAMAMTLDGVEEPDLAGVDWTNEAELATLATVNDFAYQWPEGTFAAGLLRLPRERLHIYAARLDAEAVATMMTIDFGEDTEITFVGTMPRSRGHGLATALMARSLWDARQRGQRTATLQATKAGFPIYQRLGFRDLGTLQMWERRQR